MESPSKQSDSDMLMGSQGSLDGGSVLAPLPSAASIHGSKLKRSPYLYSMTTSRDREPKDKKPLKPKPKPAPAPPSDFFNLKRPNSRPDTGDHKPSLQRNANDGGITEKLASLVIDENKEGVEASGPSKMGKKRTVSFSSETITTPRHMGSVSASALSASNSENLKYYYNASAGSLRQFLDNSAEVTSASVKRKGSSASIAEDPFGAVARNDQWKTVVTTEINGIGVSPLGSKSMANMMAMRRSNMSAQQLAKELVAQQRMARSATVGGRMRSAGLSYGSSNFQQNGMNAGWNFDQSKGNADWGAPRMPTPGTTTFAHATPTPQPLNRLQARMAEMEQEAMKRESAGAPAAFPAPVQAVGRQM
mmetsp:Transcript_24118/g.48836  ORF Transcript_24118/g.48836 Transcript_24118/m.48836 type:complete len:363 (-) Transcript_24118:386-1474(-)